MEDDDNAIEGQTKLRAQNEKEKRMLELLKDVKECKSKPRSWMNKVPAKNQFLRKINDESKSIKHARKDIESNLAGKDPQQIFEQCLNAELKHKILEETNRCATQKNITNLFNVEDLETFNSILLLTG